MTLPFNLAGIYDSEPDLYRRGEDQAFLVIERCVGILRPWRWYDVSYRDEVPEIPPKIEESLVSFIDARRSASYESISTLGEMLVWASRRTRWDPSFYPGDDDTAFSVRRLLVDSQPCMGKAFNRRFIREVLQTFIEDGATNVRPIEMWLCEKAPGEHLLSIHSANTEAFVMGLKDTEDMGTDAIPGQWRKNIRTLLESCPGPKAP